MRRDRFKGRHDICRGKDCAQPIIWLRTLGGNWLPVNPPGVLEGDNYFDRQRHTAHYATCANAEQFRRRQRKDGN